MAASMRDVARLAGVSIKTVSNVVNDYPFVRAETRSRVRAALDTLDYRPNTSARGLRTGRTDLIALAIPALDEPYFAGRGLLRQRPAGGRRRPDAAVQRAAGAAGRCGGRLRRHRGGTIHHPEPDQHLSGQAADSRGVGGSAVPPDPRGHGRPAVSVVAGHRLQVRESTVGVPGVPAGGGAFTSDPPG